MNRRELTLRHSIPYKLRNHWPPPKVYGIKKYLCKNQVDIIRANCKNWRNQKSNSWRKRTKVLDLIKLNDVIWLLFVHRLENPEVKKEICTAKHNNEASVWRATEYDTTFVYKQNKRNRLTVELLRNASHSSIETPIMSQRAFFFPYSHLQNREIYIDCIYVTQKTERNSFN